MNTTGATPADQARSLGLVVGDTIEGREGNHTARLKLLWVGDDVAVWRYWSRVDGGRTVDYGESASLDLSCRDWVKVEVRQ
jgi:hypothetical protein